MSKFETIWEEFRVTVESLENDMMENTKKANISAGIRMRKGLRQVKKLVADMLRESVKTDKEIVAERKEKNHG